MGGERLFSAKEFAPTRPMPVTYGAAAAVACLVTAVSWLWAEQLSPIRLPWLLLYFTSCLAAFWVPFSARSPGLRGKYRLTSVQMLFELAKCASALMTASLFAVFVFNICSRWLDLLACCVLFAAALLASAIGLVKALAVPAEMGSIAAEQCWRILVQDRLSFGAVLIADILTSMSGAITFQIFSAFAYPRSAIAIFFYWFVYSFPFWLRMRQCLAEACDLDSAAWMLPIVNSLKYLLMIPSAMVLFNDDARKGWLLLVTAASTVLCAAWDIFIDWGVLHQLKSKRTLPVSLAFGIVFNCLIRLLPLFYVQMLSPRGWAHEPVEVGYKLQLLEVIRRLVWLFYRIDYCATFMPEALNIQLSDYNYIYEQ
jgi:hypothetical protein